MTSSDSDMAATLRISGFIEAQNQAHIDAALDAIFFESSNTKSFVDAETRHRFRHRWLGRYLSLWPELASIAHVNDDVAGYLVGCLIDPTTLPTFNDIGYFQEFASLTKRYPAHLHVNVDARYRGAGLGAKLVNRFLEQVHQRGVAGVHVVTSRGARNVKFYERLGFVEAGSLSPELNTSSASNADLVFLARSGSP